MLVILSPAKTMDMSVVRQEFPGTTPEYATEAEYLAEQMRRFSEFQLEKMLKISPKLAAENYERYQRFGSFRILANRLCLLITVVYSRLLIRILFL